MAEFLELRLYVDPTAAILAGNIVTGDQVVQITMDDLKRLTEGQRAELATAFRDGDLGQGFREKGVSLEDRPAVAPTVEEVFLLLDHRIAQRTLHRQRAEEVRAAEEAAQKTAEEKKIVEKQEAERQAYQRILRLQDWVKANGDDSQKARLREGLLPEEEILESLTEAVFDALDSHERYTPMKVDDVCECSCAPEVQFSIVPSTGFTDQQYKTLLSIREDAPEKAEVLAMMHVGRCPRCGCNPQVRNVVHVLYDWHGIPLRRKYVP